MIGLRAGMVMVGLRTGLIRFRTGLVRFRRVWFECRVVRESVGCLIMIVVSYRFAAAHAVTHIVVGSHVQLVHWTLQLLHPGSLPVEQRPRLR